MGGCEKTGPRHHRPFPAGAPVRVGDAAGTAGDSRRPGQRGHGAGGGLAPRGPDAGSAAPTGPGADGCGHHGAAALSAGPTAVPGPVRRVRPELRGGIVRLCLAGSARLRRCAGRRRDREGRKQKWTLGSQERGTSRWVQGVGGRNGWPSIDGGWPGVPSAALRRPADGGGRGAPDGGAPARRRATGVLAGNRRPVETGRSTRVRRYGSAGGDPFSGPDAGCIAGSVGAGRSTRVRHYGPAGGNPFSGPGAGNGIAGSIAARGAAAQCAALHSRAKMNATRNNIKGRGEGE